MRHWEDFHAGDVTEIGPVSVSEEEMSPSPSATTRSRSTSTPRRRRTGPFGGLIASGWHDGRALHGHVRAHDPLDSASMGSPGVEEIRWTAPVRPGDTLTGRVTIDAVKASETNPGRGTVFTTSEVFNQDGELVMRLQARGFFARASAT
jgi:Acyl dehydratase